MSVTRSLAAGIAVNPAGDLGADPRGVVAGQRFRAGQDQVGVR
ncbi:hypothetical protein SHJG_5608 [Streptomyces hygroscopicus subsp. jinggangensis 5008]|nr:hypothetical protein SHJG_5608 [Streptomyces hygroscopicus subsp. jinggangensis 5008]